MSKIHFRFGQGLTQEPLTAQGVASLTADALKAAKDFRNVGLEQVFDVFDRLRAIWNNPLSPYRIQAKTILIAQTGFSEKMIEMGLQELPNLFDRFSLKQKLLTELRDIPISTGAPNYFWDAHRKRAFQFQPLGAVLHVLSGNVFLVGPGSLVGGLITGNVSVLKMSSQETEFLPLFLRSLCEADPEHLVTSSIALLEFSSSETEILEELKKSMDGIVVWGGEEAIQAYRNHLPARTRLITFGPKLSFGVVTQSGVDEEASDGIENVANAIGQELAIWDQNACTAPQTIFVETPELAQALVEALPKALNHWEEKIPSGVTDPDQAVDIRKLRGIFEVAESKFSETKQSLKDSGLDNLKWTVLLGSEIILEPSPLHRTVRIIPYVHLDQLESALTPVRGYLQTLGYCASTTEVLELTERFSRLGAQRVFRLGSMFGGEVDDPHDGQYDLPQFLTLAVIDLKLEKDGFHPWDLTSLQNRKKVQENLLREVLSYARKAPTYVDVLSRFKFKDLQSLSELPIILREDWEKQMFPISDRFQTKENLGGYITRSGGSSGTPKFSYFDQRDWRAMLTSAVRIFRASGFSHHDRIANFMSAGDLYGSFISFNHVNFELGAQNYCLAHQRDPHVFVELVKQFGINAVQGVPSVLLELLRQAKAIYPKLVIQKFMYAGQPLSSSDRVWLKSSLDTQIICSIIGTTEANQIGYQCPFLEGSAHHLAEDYNLIEIVDEEGAAVKDGLAGRILVTALQKHNYPVLRYNLGDAGKISPEVCACGRLDRVIEYLGRWDDIICIGRQNLKVLDLRAALDDLPMSQLQIIASFGHRPDGHSQEKLLLKVETELYTDLSLIGKIKAALDEKIPEFYRHHHSGELQIEVELFPIGAIERNHRTGKVKSVIDLRGELQNPGPSARGLKK